MESNNVISLEVLSSDREGITEDKTIQLNLISKQTESMSIHQSTAESSKQNTSSNMNTSSDLNKRSMCDDDLPNIFEHSIDKAAVVHTYENSTQITDELSKSGLSNPAPTINPQTVEEGASYILMDNYISILSNDELSATGLSNPTQTMSIIPQTMEEEASYVRMDNYISILPNDELSAINPQTMEEEASYVRMDNYISILSNDELNEGGISNKPEAILIKSSKAFTTKPPEAVSTKPIVLSQQRQTMAIRGSNDGISDQNAPKNIDMNDLVNLPSIYEDIIDKDEPDVVSTYDNNTKISRTDQLHKTCKSKNLNKKLQARIMTSKCKLALTLLIGMVITVPIVSLIVWGVKSRDKDNQKLVPAGNLTSISHANQSKMASIAFTAWATAVVSYSAGTTLIFNDTDEEQNGFNQTTGLFTCPITGIYYVFVTLRKYNRHNIYVDVLKMNTTIIRFAENNTGSPWNTVSNSALVSCSMGEIIQMKGWSSGSIYGEANVRCSSFSVIKVDQISQNSPNQTFVGYSGYATSQSLRVGDVINFPNPLYNVGKKNSSNRFTCPYTGIYFVSVTYWKYPSTSISKSVDAHLSRGDSELLASFHENNPYTYVTNNALVRCHTGEYIENRAGGKSYVYGSGSYPESIFTVMSVHQEDESQPFIGFSRFKPMDQNYSAGDVITFTGIIMDEENCFKSNHFVCPVDGSYYFLLNLMKYGSSNINADLMHGNQTIFKLSDTQRSNQYNTISNSAVIRCLKDAVVAVVAAGKGWVYGESGNNLVTFSGFLLFNN